MWRARIILFLWVLVGIATIVAMGAAMHKKKTALHKGINISINGVNNQVFVDEKAIESIVKQNGFLLNKRQSINEVKLGIIEKALLKNPWVKKAEAFFDNNAVLQIVIFEKEPIARIFTLQGNSFYIDSFKNVLPLSNNLSARVPVFTSFPSNKIPLSTPDSLVMNDVLTIAKYIQKDSFWMAQIAQIDVLPNKAYELIPLIGNHVVVLGTADSLDAKLSRLNSFYAYAFTHNEVQKYEKIDVQYNGQIVASKRGAIAPIADTAAALRNITNTINGIDKQLLDTANNKKQVSTIVTTKDITVKKAVTNGIVNNTTSKKATNKTAKDKKIVTANKNKTNTKQPAKAVMKPKTN